MNLPKLVGVIHLPPLSGSPRAHGMHPAESLQKAGLAAIREAQALEQAGFDALVIENFGDTPFYKKTVPPETVSCMAILAAAVRDTVKIQVGINVLRNDARSALAIAAVTGCDFIRVNVLSGVAAADQGLIEGEADTLMRERDRLHAPVAVFADVHVKHAITLSSADMTMAIEEAGSRSMADAVIVTGRTTGRLIDAPLLHAARRVTKELEIPLYIGSGVIAERIKEIRPWVDGIIVGSALRKGGIAGAPLDLKKTKEFAREFSRTRVKTKKRK